MSAGNVPSWLDELIYGIRRIFSDGTQLPARSALNFIGATVEDDEENDRTNVAYTGGGLAAVVGSGALSFTGTTTRTGAIAAASASVPGTMSAADKAFSDSLQDGTASLEANDIQAEIDVRVGSSCLVAATPDPDLIGFGRNEFRCGTTGIEFADEADGTVRRHARRLRGIFADEALWVAYDGDVITADGGTVTSGLQLPDAADPTPNVVVVVTLAAGVEFILGTSTMMGAGSWTQPPNTRYMYVSDTGGDWSRFPAS